MKRMLRVNELLKREIGQILERHFCPQINGLLTVTRVETAPDLRQAVVWVSIYGAAMDEKEQQKIVQQLNQQRATIQRQIARNVVLKYTPRLDFRLDSNLDKVDRVWQLLDSLDQNADKKR